MTRKDFAKGVLNGDRRSLAVVRVPSALVQAAWGLTNDYFETPACTEAQPQAAPSQLHVVSLHSHTCDSIL